jgi:FkbM family methyltransferase
MLWRLFWIAAVARLNAREWCHSQSAAAVAESIAHNSYCPDSHWLDEVLPLLTKDGAFVHLTAGANKGFGVLGMLQRFGIMRQESTVQQWYAQLKKFAGRSASRQLCGFCCPCLNKVPPYISHGQDVDVMVHAIEPLRENVAWLHEAIKHFKFNNVVNITAAALANASQGSVALPARMATGKENVSPHLVTTGSLSKHAYTVPTLSVDHYLRSSGIHSVQLASFDAEGWDPLILEGMQESLVAGRVDVFEFEYSVNGRWWGNPINDKRELASVLHWLKHIGFDCFWQGNSGCLAPALLPLCKVSRLNNSAWVAGPATKTSIQNLVCSRRHRIDVTSLLWDAADRCLRSPGLVERNKTRGVVGHFC